MEAPFVPVPPQPSSRSPRRVGTRAEPQPAARPRTSYRIGPAGIEISDRRQLTHGAIVPNFVVDLYLPIIGYDGLGVLTLLYRLANTDDRVLTNLDAFARAGRVGFRRFSHLLQLLNELAIVAVQKPSGAARLKHHRTVIALLDPPTAVPAAMTSLVLNRTLTPWLVSADGSPAPCEPIPTGEDTATRNCHLTGPELVANSSTSCQPTVLELPNGSPKECTHLQDEPVADEPIRRIKERAGTAALRRVSTSPADTNGTRDQRADGADGPEPPSVAQLWQQHAIRPCPLDTAQLRTLGAQYGETWVSAAITSIGERAPIGTIEAVRVTLERWRRENSWGSPRRVVAEPTGNRPNR